MGVIITTAGEKLMARLQAEGKPLVIDTFIFAEIPRQDYEADIDPGMALPAESRIRLRYPIPEEYRAYVNPMWATGCSTGRGCTARSTRRL